MTQTTISLFRYPNRNRLWAASQMQLAIPALQKTKGLSFFKMMGSGAENGFSPKPNWNVYALLGVWDSASAADDFFHESSLIQRIEDRSDEQLHVRLRAFQTHGYWDKKQPFKVSENILMPDNQPVAVLTRARIRWTKVREFWKYVGPASAAIANHPDAVLSIGVGELPLIYQATFSIWNNMEAVKKFAYQDPAHGKVVRLTRTQNWYSEEMFNRFWVERIDGTWNGQQVLVNL